MLSGAQVSLMDFAANIGVVTLGNTVGGAIVAGAYYAVYLSGSRPQDQANAQAAAAASKPGEVVASVPRLRVPAPSQIVAMEEVDAAAAAPDPQVQVRTVPPRMVAQPARFNVQPARPSNLPVTRPVLLGSRHSDAQVAAR